MDVPGASAVAAAVADGSPVLVLSAHLDDAVLSCGGLLAAVAQRCPLTVATLFTAAAPPPHTHAATSFLRQCSAPDAATLFADRRAEDREVLDELGARLVHLGVTDALFRPRSASLGPLGRALPELVHRYPTYRYDIARGRVSRGDRTLTADLVRRVAGLVEESGARLVLAPVGIGRHVDHLITRSVGAGQRVDVVHYSDFPYDLTGTADPAFLDAHRLEPWSWADVRAKEPLIRGYRTQVDALFPDGVIPLGPETYYEARTP
ncbi:MAG: PIG-L family deacetylase [Pseudonocardia sp.]|nr:PIG-L family deacetylase [Pseudonocardia sp.]